MNDPVFSYLLCIGDKLVALRLFGCRGDGISLLATTREMLTGQWA